jgi:hypothetical protein
MALGFLLSVGLSLWTGTFLCLALFAYHLVASIFYWHYSLTHSADSNGYYQFVPDGDGLGLSTRFVGAITAFLREMLSASYLDLFMLFHIFGYVGLVLLYVLCHRVLQDHPEGRYPELALKVGVFLPGLHFWTCAIGKDSLIFLAIVGVIWSLRSARRRAVVLLCGLALCFFIRPHIATALLGACALALVSSSDVPLRWRIPAFGLVLIALWFAVPLLIDFLKLEDVSMGSVAEYIERRQGDNLDGGTSVDISTYSFPMQFFTYMFRPLFLDASGGLALVVSVENLLYLGLCLYLTPDVFRALWHGHGGFFMRFNFVFWLAATSILAATTANMGLAIRQKTMVLPSLLLVLLTAYATTASTSEVAVPATAE